jgi:SpoVK/Ycf46/Vps4 family AAA+-type ATPase
LSGPAGGGKTSTIKCIANEMHRHIINISLDGDITKKQMENLFFSENIQVINGGKTEQIIIPIEKRIYVFEDIDCQGSDVVFDREHKNSFDDNEFSLPKLMETFEPIESMSSYNFLAPKKTQINKKADNKTLENAENMNEKLTLSCLLNIMDGILETPGRIIIMTSNYPQKLDKALIRPGRIDLICEFTKCTNAMIVEFFEKFYDIVLDEPSKKEIRKMQEFILTPAEMTKMLFENIGNYREALKRLKDITNK